MARHIRRLILWTTAGLLSLAVLAALAIALLVWGIDPDVHRARIERAASAALGRRVELTGALRWRPGLEFGIESLGGRIANAEGFGEQPLASWQALRFGVALRPLLHNRLEIERVEIHGLRLNLARGANGVNWSLPASAPAQSDPQLALAIGSIRLRDVAVVFSDADSSRAWSAVGLELDVKLPARLQAPELVFSDLSMRALISGPPLQQAGVAVRLQLPRLQLDQAPQRLRLPEWRLIWDDANLDGTLDATSGAAPVVEGRLRVQAPSLRRLLRSVSIDAPATRDAAALGPLRLDTHFRSTQGGLGLTQLQLALDSTRVDGVVNFDRLAPLSMRFDLSADTVDLDRYLSPQDQPGKPLTLPLAQLRALDAKGVMVVRRATMAGAAARGMRIDVD
jgi:AsmA protein